MIQKEKKVGVGLMKRQEEVESSRRQKKETIEGPTDGRGMRKMEMEWLGIKIKQRIWSWTEKERIRKC